MLQRHVAHFVQVSLIWTSTMICGTTQDMWSKDPGRGIEDIQYSFNFLLPLFNVNAMCS